MQLFGFSYIFRNGTQTKNLYSAMWPFYFLPKPNYMFHIINPKPNMITATKDTFETKIHKTENIERDGEKLWLVVLTSTLSAGSVGMGSSRSW